MGGPAMEETYTLWRTTWWSTRCSCAYVCAVATLALPIQGIKNPDKKLSEFFKKIQRQKPHSKEHKLGVIVPFRDGCSAMSQARAAVPDLFVQPQYRSKR